MVSVRSSQPQTKDWWRRKINEPMWTIRKAPEDWLGFWIRCSFSYSSPFVWQAPRNSWYCPWIARIYISWSIRRSRSFWLFYPQWTGCWWSWLGRRSSRQGAPCIASEWNSSSLGSGDSALCRTGLCPICSLSNRLFCWRKTLSLGKLIFVSCES